MWKFLARLVVVIGLVSVALVTVQVQPAAASGCDDAAITTEAALVAGVDCFNLETSGTTVLELTNSFALSATLQINNATTAKLEILGGGNTITGGAGAIDAIQVAAGDVTLRDVTITGATDDGLQLGSTSAIVRVENATIELSSERGIRSLGALTVVDSAIVTNGSGIWAETSSNLTVTNSTIAGSTAGTGIVVDGAAIVTGATITDNSSNGLGGIFASGTVTLIGSLIARNAFGSCNTFSGLVVTDGGANLSSDNCGPILADPAVTTGLGALGPSVCGSGRSSCTPTVPIGIDSPAVDLWGDCSPLTTDQRGVVRSAGKCDAGAFEGLDCPPTITDEATFGLAIRCYNRAPAGSATTLSLTADIGFTGLPSQMDNATTATLTIQGNGHVLTGKLGEDYAPFVKSGDLTLEQVTLTGSSANGIDVGQGAVLTINDSTISESADNGIRAAELSSVTVQNSTISRTVIGSEGIQASFTSNGPAASVTVDNSTISGFLGGIAASGQLTVTNSAILRVLGGIRGYAGSSVTVTNSTLDSCAPEANCFPSSGLEIDGTSTLTGVTIVDFSNGIRGSGSATIAGSLITRINNSSCFTGDGLVVTDGGGSILERDCGGGAIPNINSAARTGVDSDATPSVCGAGFTTCTPTVKIDVTSLAVDGWGDCSPMAADQRGGARTAGKCDAGAYEAFDCPAATVSTEAELAFAIRCYNEAAASDTVVLTLLGDLVLASSVPAIDNATGATLTINGGGNTLTVPAGETGIRVDNGDVTVQHLVLDGGRVGFELHNASVLHLIESTVSGMTEGGGQSQGAAVASSSGYTGEFTMLRSTADDNDNGVEVYGTVTVTDSTISNSLLNGLTTRGATTITNSTIAGNGGGGIRIGNGVTRVENTTIVHNTQGVSVAFAADGQATFVDSISANNNGACSGSVTAAFALDGGGNFMTGQCGAIAGYSGPNPPTGTWYQQLPDLAQNSCAAGVNCTQTIAIPAGFPAAGLGETCSQATDQRGIDRPATECDAGAFELANQAPTAGADNFATMTEDDSATPLDVLGNDTDPDNNSLTVTGVSNITGDAAGSVVVDGDALGVTYTPTLNFNGPVTFDYAISDGLGGTDTGTASVAVNPVNDPPTTMPDDLTTFEDNLDSVFVNVIANDNDVDGQALVLTNGVQIDPIDAGVPSRTQTDVAFIPAAGFIGDATITYTVTDGTFQVTGTVNVTVTEVNDPPVAVDDTFPDEFTVLEDSGPTPLDVLANDTDEEGGLFVQSVTQPTDGGTVAVVGGDVVFTPALNFSGFVRFTYTIEDAGGLTDTATVDVTVTEVNDPPVAVDDDVNVDEDSFTNEIRVLDNDSDIENPTLDVISFTPPSHGTVQIISERWAVYTPPPGFIGSTSFTYTIEDLAGATDTATVNITVDPVNDAPVANIDAATVVEDSANNLIDVLANDTDVENDTLTISSVTQPSNGLVVIGPGALDLRYTPDAGYEGFDPFTYTVTDGNGGSDSANVSVFVSDSNRSPDAVDDTFEVDRGTTATLDVLGNDSDPDGDSFTIVQATQPFPSTSGTTALINGDTAVSFTALPGFTGAARFTYVIVDAHGRSDSAFVTLVATGDVLCDPNYLPCVPISTTDLDCSDIQVAVRVIGDDIHNFDANGDGTGCESFGTPPPLPPLCDQKVVTINMQQGATGLGTPGADVILGTEGADVINGLDGDDTVCGLGGDDVIRGGPGRDVIFGDRGRDRLFGDQGNDEIYGGLDIDYVFGNDGDDTLDGEGGSDRMFGGSGDDLIKGDSGADRMFGGPGDDEMFGMGGQDSMWGEAGNDLMQGNFQSDNLFGGPGDDTMFGAGGKDTLFGEGGDDSLNGGDNTDYLNGGADVDVANGGRGRDKPLTEPKVSPGNGRFRDGAGCIAETIINCQPTP